MLTAPNNKDLSFTFCPFKLFFRTPFSPFFAMASEDFTLYFLSTQTFPDTFRPFLRRGFKGFHLILSVHSNFFRTPFSPFFATPSEDFTLYSVNSNLLQTLFGHYFAIPCDIFTLYFLSTRTFSEHLSALSLPLLQRESGIFPLHCPLYHCPLLPPPYRLHPVCNTKDMRLAENSLT